MTKPAIILTNAKIVTMDPEFRYFPVGHVVVRGNTIESVNEGPADLSKFQFAEVVDGTGKLIMPGLINTHTHVPMSIFRGYADDLPLHEWLYEYIFPIESEFINPENVTIGTRLAVAEMLRSGTTTFNDMYYFVDEIAKVVDKTGIRAVLSEGVIDFPAPNSPQPEKGLEITEQLIKTWASHPRISIAAAAHSPYSCSALLMKKIKEIADKYGTLFNIHLAETRKEFDESLAKTGFTPTSYLHSLGLLDTNMIAAHGVHLTHDDIDLLAEKGVSVAHNPECNMKLASGVAPVPSLLRAGVKVGFGTDGVASNNNLDLFAEMNTAAILHKLTGNDPTLLDARTVVEMATIGGARVLGMQDQIGSIEPGKKADLIILDMMQPHAHPVYNIYSLIVYSMQGSDVESVIIDGEFVMRGKKFTRFDEQGMYDKVEEIAEKIKIRSVELARMNGLKTRF